MNDDATLLRHYVDERSEAAFGELVRRHLNLVYFAALRRTGGNAPLAEDIAQGVFTTLAREAAGLITHTALTGWLYTTTRNVAAKAVRGEVRRKQREQEAQAMHELSSDPIATVNWERLRPVIDAALDELSDRDREAVLWRCWDGRAYGEIAATLGVSEDAARMRVDRALDKLREQLAARGLTSTGVALAAALGGQAALAAPAGLAASVTSGALASTAVTSGGVVAAAKVFTFMSTAKIMVGVTGIVVVAATALVMRQQQTTEALRTEIATLRADSGGVVALKAENQRLVEARKTELASAQIEHDELVKLREAREAFRKQLAQRREAAGGGAGATGAGGGGAVGGGDNSTPPGMVSVDVMQNVGNSTPTATAETLVWAMQHGDVKRAAEMLTLGAAEKEKLAAFIQTMPEKMREDYGTPEQLIAFMLSGSPKPMGSVQLLGKDQISPNEEVQHVQVQFQDGDFRRDDVHFLRDGSGWKQLVSPTTVDRVIAYFKGKQ